MKNKLLLLVVLILAGCVPCWNPLYTEKDLVFDPALVGTWTSADAKQDSRESWTFSKTGDKLYQLQQIDEDGHKAQFQARLVQLKEHQFLDLYLSKVEDDDVKLNVLARFSLVPAHLILKVEQIEPAPKLAPMNPEWMKEFLKKHPDAIAHRVVYDGNVALTSSTAELQKFVLEHLNDKEFFGGPMELRRKGATAK